MNPDYALLAQALLPEIALVVGALLVLGLDLAIFRRQEPAARYRLVMNFGAMAVTVALIFACSTGFSGPVFGDVLFFDTLALITRQGVLMLTLFTFGIACDARRLRHPAEYVAVILFAATGLILMAAAQQLLLAFLALELASISLYVLAGFDKSRPESAEAALKYFLIGGMAAAFLLFGFSLLYGLTGSLILPQIGMMLMPQGPSPLLLIALVMVLVAFGFKTAAAPFHLWAPDAYQGAPTPSAALIASASKLAGLVFFYRLLWPGLGMSAGDAARLPFTIGWVPVVALLSGASLLLGNIAALAQTNIRRLLAYSAIAHAGAMLLGVIAAGASGPAPLFYYAFTYAIAAIGAFGVIALVENAGRCENLADLAGLHRRSPLLAGCLLVFILSLAGIPPLAGFFGKFVIFAAALKLNGLGGPAGWLAVAAILLSAVALYYYLLILKQALVVRTDGPIRRITVPPAATATLLTAAGLLVLFGLFPSVLLGLFQ